MILFERLVLTISFPLRGFPVARAIGCICALWIFAGLAAAPALALDPERGLRQYQHTRWTASEGAPDGIARIVQTPDGYLWLASYKGLFRFDGISFERVDSPTNVALEDFPTALLLGDNGELWIYYNISKRFAVYRDGRIHPVAAPKPEGTVAALAQTPNGDLWVAGGRPGQPMLRRHNGQWSKIRPGGEANRDIATSMAVTADGALWVSYSNSVFRWTPRMPRFERMLSEPGARMKLSLDPQGRVWVTGVGGSRPITEGGGRWTGRLVAFRYPGDNHARRGWPMFDRDGNLWIARRKDGVERLRRPSASRPPRSTDVPEQFLAQDGLSSDAAYTIYEDREGNIWVGTTVGLDRFRDADVVREPSLTKTSAYGDVLFADKSGNVYIGERNAIYIAEPRAAPRLLLSNISEPEAICDGPGKSVWLVLSDNIAVLTAQSRSLVSKPKGLQTGVRSCGMDRWGNLWLAADTDGFFRWTGSGWKRLRDLPSKQFRPSQMVVDRAGDLWVNGGSGQIGRVDRAGPSLIATASSTGLPDVRTMAAAGDGLLLAGVQGLAFRRGRDFSRISVDQVGSLIGVNGVVATSYGQTWIFNRDGLIRISTKDFDRALRDRTFRISTRIFDILDGLIDSNSVRVSPSLVVGGDGRLWASTATGIVWVDPARLTFNPLAPIISISSVEVNGRRFRDPAALRLPSGSSSIVLGFAAPGLRMPERIEVRYKLEGQDQNWTDPGIRRQAFYTNLGPGTYRFRVIAANESGVWNRNGESLEITIPPTFTQSIWFKLIMVLALMAILAIGYVVRVRQVTARLQNRFTIRIAERERIARELHDTLLQGFQGLLLQFKAIANKIPSEYATRKSLDAAVVRAQQLLVEGRNRVKDLRVLQANSDLAETIIQRASELTADGVPSVQLMQEGSTRSLHPLVAVEVQRIAEEAITNAIAHAQASNVEIMLCWGRRELRLAVRDDGIGMPRSIVKNGGRDGHFGIIGMRERAERIGGVLSLTSRKSMGTEIALAVPARAAYNDLEIRLRDRIKRFIVRIVMPDV